MPTPDIGPTVDATADATATAVIARSVVENIDLADDYFPFISLTWKERFAHTWNPQSSFHPGARGRTRRPA